MTFTFGRRALLITAVTAVLVAAGVAYAAIPDASGTIHACYHVNGQHVVDGGSNLRVIDPSSSNKDGRACKNDEVELDFNQHGAPGTNGTNGVSGWELVKEDFPLPAEGDDFVGTDQQNEVDCSSGKNILGGGVTTDDWTNSIVRFSGPNAAGTGWIVNIQRTNDGDSPFHATTQAHQYAICADVS